MSVPLNVLQHRYSMQNRCDLLYIMTVVGTRSLYITDYRLTTFFGLFV